MAATHECGRLFICWQRLIIKAPHYSVAPTYEVSPPYRRSRSVVLRWWLFGLVIGWWEYNPRLLVLRNDPELYEREVDRHLLKMLKCTYGPDADHYIGDL